MTVEEWKGQYTDTDLERRWLHAWRGVECNQSTLHDFFDSLGDEPRCVLGDFVGQFTREECEQVADLWGVPEWCRSWRDDAFWQRVSRRAKPVVFLYKVSQTAFKGYETYGDAVVAARSADDARRIHPRTLDDGARLEWRALWTPLGECPDEGPHDAWVEVQRDGRESEAWEHAGAWPSPEHVTATYIGVASGITSGTVVCASFRAG